MARDLRINRPRNPMIGKGKGYAVDTDEGIWEYGIPTGPAKGDMAGSNLYRDGGRGGGGQRAFQAPGPGNPGGQYQPPGTSGLGDWGLGVLWDSNPEYFGSDQWQWGNLGDVTQQSSIWQQYLDAMADGLIDSDYYQGMDMFSGLNWDQAEAAYNWDQAYGPESGGTLSGGQGLTDVTYNQGFISNLQGSTNTPPWMYTTSTTAQGGSLFGVGIGGGNIGGSGDLGTGSAFAGGSMYNTQTGGGLWDYDCTTQGPSYNSAGECIACCE